MLGSSGTSRRKKDADKDRDSPKSKDKDRDRHKTSKSSRTSRKSSTSAPKDGDKHRDRERDTVEKERIKTPSSQTERKKKMAVVPELERRGSMGSPNGSRTSLPYPNFSKTHSKESIYGREEPVERRKSPFTPEPTDLGEEKGKENARSARVQSPGRGAAPPSPPLTATTGADLRKTASANSMRRNVEAMQREMEGGRRSVDSGTRLTPEPRVVHSSVREGGYEAEGTSLTSATESSEPSTIRHGGKPARQHLRTSRPGSPFNARPPGRAVSASASTSQLASEITQSTDSDATSIAPPRVQNVRKRDADSPTDSETSPPSAIDSSPRTPTQHSAIPSVLSAQKDTPGVEIITDFTSRPQSVNPDYADSPLTPPPPPPPPALITEAPRVDYLLQHGGLKHTVPRSLLSAADNGPVMGYSQYASPRPGSQQPHIMVEQFFSPFQTLLESYGKVMDSNGSVAVATGYRSVARRLLERLEAVFARNIASEFCKCTMCLQSGINPNAEHDDSVVAGVNWGEILELVSGRCELPPWPPLDPVDPHNTGLGISELQQPCTQVDVDIPEQHREYYVRQSQKTKNNVQSWLSNQTDAFPEDGDDETLTFAVVTRLPPEKRPVFYSLMYGLKKEPSSQHQSNADSDTSVIIQRAAIAVQRLYRLHSAPRGQLVTLYLMKNPDMHSILATLAAITKHEWEILISGRFDGFLWSGAETHATISSPGPGGSRAPSRGVSADYGFPPNDPNSPRRLSNTPLPSFSQFMAGVPAPSQTPISRPGSRLQGTGPAPVQIDEDTEIAVLAEVEREIFSGMEALEDAFERLHNQAEVVRRKLRERGAALSMVAQARRGYASGGIEVRTDTPASFAGNWDNEGLEDLRSEIAPDDSASNVSHNRRRKDGRKKERRIREGTIEEEEIVSVEETPRKERGSRRRR